MFLWQYSPITSGIRGRKRIRLRKLSSLKFHYLNIGRRSKERVNYNSKIVFYHRGGGHKKLLRIVDNYRRFSSQSATVRLINRSPWRGGFIALIKYKNGGWSYILAAEGGDRFSWIHNKNWGTFTPGSAGLMGWISYGYYIYNLELAPGRGGTYIRAAGTTGKILRPIEKGITRIRLPSKKILHVGPYCMGVLGRVTNEWHKLEVVGKAGVNRGRNYRPIVRGMAMNAVDHPHGGKSGPSRSSVTPWGKPTK